MIAHLFALMELVGVRWCPNYDLMQESDLHQNGLTE
jgi:hypothetical protein